VTAAQPEPTTTPEPAADGSLTERVGKLETGQDTIASKVDRILGILDKPEGDAPTTTADPAPADMGEQMRQAVSDVHAEAVAAEAAKPKPEQPPREAGQPFRQRLAEVVHGREPRKP
jgi:hypothetical protein